jgi:hypothetical protein
MRVIEVTKPYLSDKSSAAKKRDGVNLKDNTYEPNAIIRMLGGNYYE